MTSGLGNLQAHLEHIETVLSDVSEELTRLYAIIAAVEAWAADAEGNMPADLKEILAGNYSPRGAAS